MIFPVLTGYIAEVFGQIRFFKSWSDARAWINNVKGVKS